ncbi:MAG: SDR family NAD(P)-dependent oxidoreductase [Opitutaceae bacterium]|jgi:3-oxoacyl-[acyl-carrier protein] reductase
MMLLQGKRVLITGASRGIGKAIAEVFVREGASVMLTARSADLELFAESLAAGGAKAFATKADLNDEAQLKQVVLKTREKLGGLDVLVNNAGVLIQGKLGMIQNAEAHRMMETNFFAMLNLTQYCIRLMAKDKKGSIINLASIAGTQGIDGISAYCASKAAVVGFTKSSAKELASQGIRVNAIAPGFIDTDMARQLDPAWFQKRVESIRLGRVGQPEDIANCALFLASELSSYITGQVIGVDGGMQV